MALGCAPFRAQTPVAVMRMQMTEPPPRPSTLVPGFPAQLETVLMRTLEKEPNDRYERVEAYLVSLAAAADSAGRVPVARGVTGDSTEAWGPLAPATSRSVQVHHRFDVRQTNSPRCLRPPCHIALRRSLGWPPW